jgi:hypothetical protein
VVDTYSGKTWIWSKGGSYFSPDAKFQAIWDGSVAVGRWYATSTGKLCYEAEWRTNPGDVSDPKTECRRHVTDSKVQIWKHDPEANSWYRPGGGNPKDVVSREPDQSQGQQEEKVCGLLIPKALGTYYCKFEWS